MSARPRCRHAAGAVGANSIARVNASIAPCTSPSLTKPASGGRGGLGRRKRRIPCSCRRRRERSTRIRRRWSGRPKRSRARKRAPPVQRLPGRGLPASSRPWRDRERVNKTPSGAGVRFDWRSATYAASARPRRGVAKRLDFSASPSAGRRARHGGGRQLSQRSSDREVTDRQQRGQQEQPGHEPAGGQSAAARFGRELRLAG